MVAPDRVDWWFYPIVVVCNVLLPLLFVFKRVRSSLTLLFIISLFVNIGMWSERLWIVITATWHDFLPHNWGRYCADVGRIDHSGRLVLAVLLLGSLVLTKFLPAGSHERHQDGHRGRTSEESATRSGLT